MKLFYSATSPFVRKCLVCAHELGLRDRLEFLSASPHPVNRDRSLMARNPLGQVPTLVTDDGVVLYDSRVICEYFDSFAGGGLIPAAGAARWHALLEQSLADGIMDAAVLSRYETAVRPESLRWADWVAGQLDKVHSALAEIEQRAGGFADRIDIGTIAVACALGYLDFRYAALEWRQGHPQAAAWHADFARRVSMTATQPPPAV